MIQDLPKAWVRLRDFDIPDVRAAHFTVDISTDDTTLRLRATIPGSFRISVEFPRTEEAIRQLEESLSTAWPSKAAMPILEVIRKCAPVQPS